MRTSRKLTSVLLSLFALAMMSAAALAADPGIAYPTTSEVSDQKAGSLLVYNYYTSSLANSNTNNTRINLTNTSSTSPVAVHLFFLATAGSCSIADVFICLTQNQTISFLASDTDPDSVGFIVAVAVGPDGCPIIHNFLIGDEYIKAGVAGTRSANLGAEAFAAIGPAAPGGACDGTTDTAVLSFNGLAGGYNRVPRVLALSSMGSVTDGNDIFLIVNRIGGNLLSGSSTLGTLFGIAYDDQEQPYSFSFPSGSCQLSGVIGAAGFPRTAPPIRTIIPAGRSGWLKFYNNGADIGILGAVITTNAGAASQANAFSGGHNLHKLTLSGTASYTIPVFPPTLCF